MKGGEGEAGEGGEGGEGDFEGQEDEEGQKEKEKEREREVEKFHSFRSSCGSIANIATPRSPLLLTLEQRMDLLWELHLDSSTQLKEQKLEQKKEEAEKKEEKKVEEREEEEEEEEEAEVPISKIHGLHGKDHKEKDEEGEEEEEEEAQVVRDKGGTKTQDMKHGQHALQDLDPSLAQKLNKPPTNAKAYHEFNFGCSWILPKGRVKVIAHRFYRALADCFQASKVKP